MNAQRAFIPFMLCLFCSLSPLTASTDAELRKELIDASRKELLSLAQNEVPQGSLGEWKNIIDSSLFMLFRRTELFRGRMRVLVVSNPSVIVNLYPEGTFVLSTGLLDFIDASLYETASDSPRRMRNFDSEREAVLIPLLVKEASHFALDHFFSAWKANPSVPIPVRYGKKEILEADRFSVILLRLCGFDPSVYDAWLKTLTGLYGTGKEGGIFSEYLSLLPSPNVRTAALRDAGIDIQKITEEFSGALTSLKTGTAFEETESALEALRQMFPYSTYINRLEALTLHRHWLASVPEAEQQLKTFLPVADEEDPARGGFLALLRRVKTDFPSPSEAKSRLTIPGNSKLYIAALEAYKPLIAAYSDSSLTSAYAMLLFWSGNRAVREQALKIGEDAARAETGSSCFTARANHASLLYLGGTDYAGAQFILESLASSIPENDTRPSVYLDQGIPGDGRDIILNSALMMNALGDIKKAQAKKDLLDTLTLSPVSVGTISLRLVHAGDSIDELVSKWGRPSEIVYNYFTENWVYPSLSASVLVVRDQGNAGTQKIRLVRLGPLSPVSPGGEIRTGDTRADFEKVFGKSAYRSGDSEVYLTDGNRLSVFYLEGKIRSIIVGL